MFKWLEKNVFSSRGYIRLDGRPVLLVFGPEYYKDDDWNAMLGGLSARPLYYTLQVKRGSSDGAFGWPLPKAGTAESFSELDKFYTRAASWPFIPPAYPRFQDIYQQAAVQPSWGSISDADGDTYARTLKRALSSGAPYVQLVTWNDWGEGTQIEPSVEFGTRDLKTAQRLRRETIDPSFAFTASDLSLPYKLYRLRKARSQRADEIADMLRRGRVQEASKALERALK